MAESNMVAPILKIAVTVSILVLGLGCAWLYLAAPARASLTGRRGIGGARPWRRLGAAMCLILTVMFVIGAHGIDIPDRWRAYAVFWILMLLLLLWLCGLALRDIWHTRRILINRRSGPSVSTRTELESHPAEFPGP